jgi:hypothetical protein
LNPREGLAVELKRWLNISTPAHQAKIIRACAAIYNSNGGYVLIGFNDDESPDRDHIPIDLEGEYESERIQQIVANHTSPPIEVSVNHARVEDIVCVVIKVPSGVITPSCIKRDFMDGTTQILRGHEVYCRTLAANGTYSSDRPRPHDWSDIMRVCLDNREADIARFLTRNFSSDRVATLARQLFALGLHKDGGEAMDGERPLPSAEPDGEMMQFLVESPEESLIPYVDSGPVNDSGPHTLGSPAARACLETGYEHFSRSVPKNGETLPPHGTWEVAAVINGDVQDIVPTAEFLNRIINANPRYTYVPMWTANSKGDHYTGNPFVMEGAWQSLIFAPPVALNFWRAEPRGFLYLLRALEDDMSRAPIRPEPMKTLELVVATLRVTESILVAIAIAKSLPMRRPPKTVEFLFRWSGLSGRELSNWGNVARLLPSGLIAHQPVVVTSVAVPIEATRSAIADFVNSATRPLFAAFDGFTLDPKDMFDIVGSLIDRRL